MRSAAGKDGTEKTGLSSYFWVTFPAPWLFWSTEALSRSSVYPYLIHPGENQPRLEERMSGRARNMPRIVIYSRISRQVVLVWILNRTFQWVPSQWEIFKMFWALKLVSHFLNKILIISLQVYKIFIKCPSPQSISDNSCDWVHISVCVLRYLFMWTYLVLR